MRLRSISIENFRSITKAKRIPLSDLTVLLGPNNEGKSNVLRALVLATRLLLGRRDGHRRSWPLAPSGPAYPEYYDWERDFPLHLQADQNQGKSVFVLEYELTNEEVREIRKTLNVRLRKTLPLKVTIGRKEEYHITVHKKGPAAKSLSSKAPQLTKFVADRIQLEYIPAIRTADSAQHVVNQMLARAISELEVMPEYTQAIEAIERLQRPVIRELSKSIKDSLMQFLPAIKSVVIKTPRNRRFEALRRCEIHINDGSQTELQYKGDGVQSLAALGLMRHASTKSSSGKKLVIAIEEPESHLHPLAIHELRAVVEQLATRHQVVITTHSPLFVSHGQASNNIIVNKRKAKPASSIEDVRKVLGVQPSDNLVSAELVLIVEGKTDQIALTALLRNQSSILDSALQNRRLAIDPLGGAANLTYKLGLLRAHVFDYHVFIDADLAGLDIYNRALKEGYLEELKATLTTCNGMKEAEFEDLLSDEIVADVLRSKFDLERLTTPKRNRNSKWSKRMEALFTAHGKPWSDAACNELKIAVAERVAQQPDLALNEYRRGPFDTLVQVLEARLSRR